MSECFITRHGGVASDDTYTYTMTEDGLFQYPAMVTIPKNVTSLTSGNVRCFDSHTEIKKVQWETGSSMTTLSYKAFNKCTGLEDVVLPDNITTIGDYAFNGCTSLKNISLNTEVKRNYGSQCFFGCNLTTETAQTIVESANALGVGVFSNNKNIKSITLPYLNNYLCSDCIGLESAIVTANYTTGVGCSFLFSGCTSLKSVVFTGDFADDTVGACSSCFRNCSKLTNITFPNNITVLPESMFISCKALQTMSVPHGVIKLGQRLFYGCTALTTVWLPNTITSGADYTGTMQIFYGCTALTDIQLEDGWDCTLVITAPTLTAASLKAMFESLADLTDTTAKTLTLGTANYNTAVTTTYTPEGSSEEVSIATIATNKNWTLQA